MMELLINILGKFSSYNFFNNLYPGVLFIYLLRVIYGIELVWNNWIEAISVYYFIGMIMSRFGSIIIETLLKKVALIKYVAYSDYIRANDIDPIINTLSEVNNTYRTLLAMFLCLLLFMIGTFLNEICLNNGVTFFQNHMDFGVLMLFVMLFGQAYIKQTSYIYKRVNEVLEK